MATSAARLNEVISQIRNAKNAGSAALAWAGWKDAQRNYEGPLPRSWENKAFAARSEAAKQYKYSVVEVNEKLGEVKETGKKGAQSAGEAKQEPKTQPKAENKAENKPKAKPTKAEQAQSAGRAAKRTREMAGESFRMRAQQQVDNFNEKNSRNKKEGPPPRQRQTQQGGASGAARQRLANANAKRADAAKAEAPAGNRAQRRAQAKAEGNLGTKGAGAGATGGQKGRKGRQNQRAKSTPTGSKRTKVVSDGPQARTQTRRPGKRNPTTVKRSGNPEVDARNEKLKELRSQGRISAKDFRRGVSESAARPEISDEIIAKGNKAPAGSSDVQRIAARGGEATDRQREQVRRASGTPEGKAAKPVGGTSVSTKDLTAKQAHDRIQAALKKADPNYEEKPFRGKNPNGPATDGQVKKLESMGAGSGTVKGTAAASEAGKKAPRNVGTPADPIKAKADKTQQQLTAKQAHDRIQEMLKKSDPNHVTKPFRGNDPDGPASQAQLKKLGISNSAEAAPKGSAASAGNAENLTAKQAHDRIQAELKKADPNHTVKPFRGKNPDAPASEAQLKRLGAKPGNATGTGTPKQSGGLFGKPSGGDSGQASGQASGGRGVRSVKANGQPTTTSGLFGRPPVAGANAGANAGAADSAAGTSSKPMGFKVLPEAEAIAERDRLLAQRNAAPRSIGDLADDFMPEDGPAGRLAARLPKGLGSAVRFGLPAVGGLLADQVTGKIFQELDPTPYSDSYLGGALKAVGRGAVAGGVAGGLASGGPGALVAAPVGGLISLGSYVLGGGPQNQESLEEAIANIRSEAAMSGTDPKLTNQIIGRLRLTAGRAQRMGDNETVQAAISGAYGEIGGVLGTPAVQNPFNVDVINSLSRSSNEQLMPLVQNMEGPYRAAAINSLASTPMAMYSQAAANTIDNGGNLGGMLDANNLSNIAMGM